MKTSEPSRKHISHCVDWLRNSIMCHSDTSVIVWQWNVHLNQSTPKARIPHSCKKFKPIQDWGKNNEILADYDHTIHLEDAPICSFFILQIMPELRYSGCFAVALSA
ncbi:hypothetical protein DFH08DRAFT_1037117 [Mycena albidolilacea]|uniref:Uncharacterized protein n=1 Tax=Mycena albidolilacea TaxID=1033008 RepID=A0AAD7EFX4_9AGAR|nr:hypothetical protein DFH08DRAFT_1037117 [Mycena albidolilacea]